MKIRIIAIIFLCSITAITLQAQELIIETMPHRASTCSGTFVEHSLDHITIADEPIGMFESNGSGLAINDLNNDGLLDIVFANIDEPESILWNEGDLNFTRQELNIPGVTRSVVILDFDGDSWRDIAFTTQLAAPSIWFGRGEGNFTYTGSRGLSEPAYSMNWADFDRDGDLDLVTGSLDAELTMILSNNYLFDGGAGVIYYENTGTTFLDTRLRTTAQALTIYFTDLNNDGSWDIVVGNDFAEPDAYWLRLNDAWVETTPFDMTSRNTMSFSGADIQNDGSVELYAVDMQPYADDEETIAAWQPVLDGLAVLPADDPQQTENILQMIEDGTYSNASDRLGINFTGWSWSSKFGDLDSDGFQDLYVVNGMIDSVFFAHLPNNELVEENQAFRNIDGSIFEPAPEWNLGSTQSGRGMSMADMDGDGDLDIVVNNLMSPSMLYENQLCSGNNLTIFLNYLNTQNTDAIGARLILQTSTGQYQREIHAASGYLSGDPSQVHFGIPEESRLEYLEIIWPDQTVSRVENLEANTHLNIIRD